MHHSVAYGQFGDPMKIQRKRSWITKQKIVANDHLHGNVALMELQVPYSIKHP
jgi:hypothetical protein